MYDKLTTKTQRKTQRHKEIIIETPCVIVKPFVPLW
jgi:hypothetical protein